MFRSPDYVVVRPDSMYGCLNALHYPKYRPVQLEDLISEEDFADAMEMCNQYGRKVKPYGYATILLIFAFGALSQVHWAFSGVAFFVLIIAVFGIVFLGRRICLRLNHDVNLKYFGGAFRLHNGPYSHAVLTIHLPTFKHYLEQSGKGNTPFQPPPPYNAKYTSVVPVPQEAALPAGWSARHDDSLKRNYYVDSGTQFSTWVDPRTGQASIPTAPPMPPEYQV